jgi:hypothetical protein
MKNIARQKIVAMVKEKINCNAINVYQIAENWS